MSVCRWVAIGDHSWIIAISVKSIAKFTMGKNNKAYENWIKNSSEPFSVPNELCLSAAETWYIINNEVTRVAQVSVYEFSHRKFPWIETMAAFYEIMNPDTSPVYCIGGARDTLTRNVYYFLCVGITKVLFKQLL